MLRKTSYPPSIPAAYPSTIVYVAGISIFSAYLGKVIELNISLLSFTLVYVLTAFAAVRKELGRVQEDSIRLANELATVHRLVNSESERQLSRIDTLEKLLHNAGEPVPTEKDIP